MSEPPEAVPWLRPMVKPADPSPWRAHWRWAPARWALELALCAAVFFGAATLAIIALVGVALCYRLEEIRDRLDRILLAATPAPEPPS